MNGEAKDRSAVLTDTEKQPKIGLGRPIGKNPKIVCAPQIDRLCDSRCRTE
jgi:hypothetical protein